MFKTIIFVAFVANILLIVTASTPSNYDESQNCTTTEPPKCGDLEVPESCVNGGCYKERKCSDIKRPFICVDVIKCEQGCLCKEGYLRNEDSKCILRNECPEKLKCPRQNEVYDPCLNDCSPGTCQSIGKQYDCPLQSANKKCTGGCVCEPGYYRNKVGGHCISEEECNKCTGPNEYFACGGGCDNVCETLSVRNQTICDIINIKCNETCYCDEGYARDAHRKCVPFDQCPEKEPRCGQFEVVNSCVNGGCYDERKCTDIGKPGICVDPIKCKKGCLCKPGYLRDAQGKCIPREKCPNFKCGKNEQLIECPALYCQPRTCEQKGTKPVCLHISPGLPCPGLPGCECKTGYLRGPDGVCIPEDQCPPKCGKFEVADDCANGGCYDERECIDIGNPTKCARPSKCEPGCLCKPGYLRDAHGKCIPREKCPNYCESDDKNSNAKDSTEENNSSDNKKKCDGDKYDDSGDNSNEKDSTGESNSSDNKKKCDGDKYDDSDDNPNEKDSTEEKNSSDNKKKCDGDKYDDSDDNSNEKDSTEEKNSSDNKKKCDGDKYDDSDDNSNEKDSTEEKNSSDNKKKCDGDKYDDSDDNSNEKDSTEEKNSSDNKKKCDGDKYDGSGANSNEKDSTEECNSSDNKKKCDGDKYDDSGDNSNEKDSTGECNSSDSKKKHDGDKFDDSGDKDD